MEDNLTTLTTEEAKNKLKAGEALENVYVERLSLSKFKFDKPLNIIDSKIDHLDLNKSTFQEEVTIRRCNLGMIVFTDTVFEKKFDFKKNRIARTRFQKIHFQDKSVFDETKFAHTSFYQTKFDGMADFIRGGFYGDVNFEETTFGDGARFLEVIFDGNANFKKSKWCGGKGDFKKITVKGDFEMSDAEIDCALFFIGAVIDLSMNFIGAKMNEYTDLRSVTVGRSIVFTHVKVGEKQNFRFYNACASSILFNREILEGHVYPEQDKKYDAAAREYGFLRTAFQEINRFDDEDWAYYQFKKMERKSQPLTANPLSFIKKAVDYLFLDIGCGYGTKPFRILGVSFLLVVAFSFIYFLFMGGNTIESYGFSSKFINKVIYSFNVSLLAFSGSYGDIKITGMVKLFAMVEYMLGVVFMGIFIVAFSRKVIR